MIKISWGGKVSPAFLMYLMKIVDDLGWPKEHASYLLSCMAFETGGTFSASIKNQAGSGAVGLIQFMPATAKDLGTTVEALVTMTNVAQLDYVKKYFSRYSKNIKTLNDMYMAILMPSFITRSDDSVMFTKGSIGYTQNKGLDRDNNGYITKGEICALIKSIYEKGLREGYYGQL